MKVRSVVLMVLTLIAGLFCVVNWPSIVRPLPVNLLVTQIEAPMGLILILIMGGLWVLGIFWALMNQAASLVEVRRAYKEANNSKTLADHAEKSRYEEIRKEAEAASEKREQDLIRQTEQLTAIARQIEQMNEAVNLKLSEMDAKIDSKVAEQVVAAIRKMNEPQDVQDEVVETKSEGQNRGFFANLFGSKTPAPQPSGSSEITVEKSS